MKNKIGFKLFLIFSAFLLLFSLIAGGFFLALFRSHTVKLNRQSMEARAVSIADTLASFPVSGSGAGGKGGYGAYMRFLQELAMAEVWVLDENRNIQTTHKSQQPISQLPENAEQLVDRVFAGEITYGEEFSGLLAESALTVGAPIRSGGKVVGAVLLHSPVSGIDEAVARGGTALAVGLGASLALSCLLAAFLSGWLTRPLTRMEQGVKAMTRGEYQVKIPYDAPDEIGRLARGLETLALRLQQAEQQRQQLEQLRERFITNISHELRTPVAVFRGSLELLESGAVTDPGEQQAFYTQLLGESRHMERLVNDFLELSRLQDSGFRLEAEPLELRDVVRDAARSIRRLAVQKEITLETELPEAECPFTGDYCRLRQLLVILLDNAVKFSPPGSGVQIALEAGDGYRISVTDHGVGIPPEELPNIFLRYRTTRSRENPNGTGLGLAIAAQIAARHGGTITAESGGGATVFRVRLPEA